MTETERLAAVRRYEILDTPPDAVLDRITAIAARVLKVPIAIISIVDHDRIWFKSKQGVDVGQLDRDLGLCASCISQEAAWVVSDARTDVRTLANPLVAGQMGIQFYLGIPLRTHDGFNLGTLCVLDIVPRIAPEDDVAVLTDLASVVMDELELRLAARNSLTSYQEELVRRELREDHIKGLMRELAHRSKNLLAVVQAIARQTAPKETSAQAYATALAGRVQILAKIHDLIAEEDWRGAKLDELVLRAVDQFAEVDESRVELLGPDLMVTPAAAQHIGLALHELATNAVRSGALSSATGRVSIRWEIEEGLPSQQWFHMSWLERGGPPVKPPQLQGSGHLVLERLTPEGLGGSAELSFTSEGVRWTCEAPSARLVQTKA